MTTRTVSQYMSASQSAHARTQTSLGKWNPASATASRPAQPSPLQAKYLAPLAACIVTMVADIVTTLVCIHSGVAHEGDPITAWAIAHYGPNVIVAPLIIITPLALLSIRLGLRRGYKVLATGVLVMLWVAAVVHGAAAFSNAEILHAAGFGL